jgi:hypothetical protein
MDELINLNVRFEGRSKGWQHCKCKVCNDYKVRASFTFEDAKIKYNCFNCGFNASYTKNKTFISKEFRELLNANNISDSDIDLALGKNFFNKDQIVLAKKKAEAKINPIELPVNSYPVTEVNPDDMWTVVADEYLQSRGLSLGDHAWYLSTQLEYRDRLIVPYFKDGNIIYWQARSFDDTAKKRYINPNVPIEPIIFGYDELEKSTTQPLFIMEGVFDAISINGIATLGSKLYKQRIDAFTKSRRRKVFVIDKKDKQNNGYKLGLDALKYGWEISFVSGETDDVNHSVTKYGKLWTIRNLIENTKSGFEAQVYLETICKNHAVNK